MTEVDRISEICNRYSVSNYNVNRDHSVDVYGNLILGYMGLVRMPFKINRVYGNFDCSNNRLDSVDGFPKEVGGSLNCSFNNITSLVGITQYIGGPVYCNDNRIESLDGLPVTKCVDISGNRLTSLLGSHRIEELICFDNPIESFDGFCEGVEYTMDSEIYNRFYRSMVIDKIIM